MINNKLLRNVLEDRFINITLDDDIKRTYQGIIGIKEAELLSATFDKEITVGFQSYKMSTFGISSVDHTVEFLLEIQAVLIYKDSDGDYSRTKFKGTYSLILNQELSNDTCSKLKQEILSLDRDLLQIMRVIHLEDYENKRYVNQPNNYFRSLLNETGFIVRNYVQEFIKINFPEELV